MSSTDYNVKLPWKLSDLRSGKIGLPKNGLKVFSCFHCAGGSTMGYKLAGFDVFGGVEIDPAMMGLYRANHCPEERFSFSMGVQEFVKKKKLPEELFNLDVLDGSPPCSVFSTNGKREKKWGQAHAFREGQATQHLDDLFFDFIDVGKRLRPKVIIAENVKGLIIGNAKGYVRDIFAGFSRAGYDVQLFLLNAAFMGAPQQRERVFFVARRSDLKLPSLSFEFSETPISAATAVVGASIKGARTLTKHARKWWSRTRPGRNFADAKERLGLKGSNFSRKRLNRAIPAPTVTTGAHDLTHWKEPRSLSPSEVVRLQTFPIDFDFQKEDVSYVCGMSVPPIMMQRIAVEVAQQLFHKKL